MSSSAPAPDLLAAIVAATYRRVEVSRELVPERDLERRAAEATPDRQGLHGALRRSDRFNIVAESKRRSPSRGVLCRDYNPVAIATAYARAGAAALSILTEPMFFDGALEHLAQVRAALALPILRKDFIVDEYQLLEARACGADAVLLIAAALDDASLAHLLRRTRALDLAALVEVHSREELQRALDAGAELVGVNNRNLRTLEVDVRTSRDLGPHIPADVLAISESGLRTREDLEELRGLGYRGFLMGERFMSEPDPGAALERLLRHEAMARAGEEL